MRRKASHLELSILKLGLNNCGMHPGLHDYLPQAPQDLNTPPRAGPGLLRLWKQVGPANGEAHPCFWAMQGQPGVFLWTLALSC
jgi:hypothetical protein